MNGFLIHSVDDGHVPAWEYLPCSAITPKVGMALTQSSGNLAIATGTTKPTYISMVDKEVACQAGDLIPVIRVTPDIIFETTNSVNMSATKGQKVTLHASSGMQVTNTTSSGVAEIIGYEAEAASETGKKVLVRFS